jgi:hypothetical protein
VYCDMNGCVHNNVSCVSSQLSRLLLYGAIAFVPYIHTMTYIHTYIHGHLERQDNCIYFWHSASRAYLICQHDFSRCVRCYDCRAAHQPA